jgi:hypothetical protein
MRRQTRPFVVEVKKKRGDTVRKLSIWGGLDLSAIAAETTERLEEVASQHSQEKAIEPPKSEDVTVSASTMALPETQIDPDIDVRDLGHEPTEEAAIEQASPKVSRRRRGSAETIPRGQRWKRRLPEVLRRKK